MHILRNWALRNNLNQHKNKGWILIISTHLYSNSWEQRSARLSVTALVVTSRGRSQVVSVSKIVHSLVSVSTVRSFPVSVSKLRMTSESQSQLSRPRLRLSEVSLSFETKTGKLLMIETETRIWTIFETETTWDLPLGVETEAESLTDLRFTTLYSAMYTKCMQTLYVPGFQ